MPSSSACEQARKTRRRALALLLALILPGAQARPRASRPARAEPPALLLANAYQGGIALRDYWISEKYDGVRGYWDGRSLRTRGGRSIAVPAWFTAGWPAVALDGELWAGRGGFEQAASTVARQAPDEAAWRRMRFMVFDLPRHPGPFTQRLQALGRIVAALDAGRVQAVAQARGTDPAALQALLARTVCAGGEGLMLHRGDSLYRAGRSDDLLKLKPHDDADARVVAHLPGHGKYEGMMGSLLVRTPEGLRFRIGSGFTDAQRRAPPPVGTWVTYRYRGVNESGLPRFASFLRVRPDGPDPQPSSGERGSQASSRAKVCTMSSGLVQ